MGSRVVGLLCMTTISGVLLNTKYPVSCLLVFLIGSKVETWSRTGQDTEGRWL